MADNSFRPLSTADASALKGSNILRQFESKSIKVCQGSKNASCDAPGQAKGIKVEPNADSRGRALAKHDYVVVEDGKRVTVQDTVKVPYEDGAFSCEKMAFSRTFSGDPELAKQYNQTWKDSSHRYAINPYLAEDLRNACRSIFLPRLQSAFPNGPAQPTAPSQPTSPTPPVGPVSPPSKPRQPGPVVAKKDDKDANAKAAELARTLNDLNAGEALNRSPKIDHKSNGAPKWGEAAVENGLHGKTPGRRVKPGSMKPKPKPAQANNYDDIFDGMPTVGPNRNVPGAAGKNPGKAKVGPVVIDFPRAKQEGKRTDDADTVRSRLSGLVRRALLRMVNTKYPLGFTFSGQIKINFDATGTPYKITFDNYKASGKSKMSLEDQKIMMSQMARIVQQSFSFKKGTDSPLTIPFSLSQTGI